MKIVGEGEELCLNHHFALLFPPDCTAQGSRWVRAAASWRRSVVPCLVVPHWAQPRQELLHVHTNCFFFHLQLSCWWTGHTTHIPQTIFQLKPPKRCFSNIQPLNVQQNWTKWERLKNLVWTRHTSQSILQKANLLGNSLDSTCYVWAHK